MMALRLFRGTLRMDAPEAAQDSRAPGGAPVLHVEALNKFALALVIEPYTTKKALPAFVNAEDMHVPANSFPRARGVS